MSGPVCTSTAVCQIMLQMWLEVAMSPGANRKAPQLLCMYNTREGSRPRQAGLLGEAETHLCPCCAISIALRAGTGDPPSVTLRTSIDFLSGRRFPCLFSIGESTRFLGGSAWKKTAVSSIYLWLNSCRLVKFSLNNFTLTPPLQRQISSWWKWTFAVSLFFQICKH